MTNAPGSNQGTETQLRRTGNSVSDNREDGRSPFRILPLVVIATGVMLHLCLLFGCEEAGFADSRAWGLDFQIFVALSLLLGVIAWIPGLQKLRPAFLATRLILYVAVGRSVIDDPTKAYLLVTALVLDAGAQFDEPWNVIAVFVVMVSSVVGEMMTGTLRPSAGIGILATQTTVPVLAAILILALRHVSDKLAAERRSAQVLNNAVIQLTSANSGFLKYASAAERESAQQERRRITRDLHDVVGQTMTDITAMMDVVKRQPMSTPDEQWKLHSWVRDQAQLCLHETRKVLYRLRAMPDAPLSGTAAIQNLARTFEFSTGISVKLEWANSPADFGPGLNTTLYRVIQEALVNSFRHGRATSVRVEFWLDDSTLSLLIEDDGHGGSGNDKGIGQTGMEERLREVGGAVTFHAAKTGYQVRVTCPRSALESYETTSSASR